jgi:hypothetical protein
MMSMMEARLKTVTLLFRVMVPELTRLSIFVLYSLVDLNQLLNRGEPLAKKKDASNRKGAVGKTGRKAPAAPIPKKQQTQDDINYIHMLSPRIMLFFQLPCFQGRHSLATIYQLA